MKCPHCGDDNPAGASFCRRCGNPVPPTPKFNAGCVVPILLLALVLLASLGIFWLSVRTTPY